MRVDSESYDSLVSRANTDRWIQADLDMERILDLD